MRDTGLDQHLVQITGIEQKGDLTVFTGHIDTKALSWRNTPGINCFILDKKNKQMVIVGKYETVTI